MLTDTMMPLCRIVPASYQEYPKYMPGICSSTPDLFNAASSAPLTASPGMVCVCVCVLQGLGTLMCWGRTR